jgi:hypothetical protein
VIGETDRSVPSRMPVRRGEASSPRSAVGRTSSLWGVTEIREFGGTSIQVMRRLRDVLEKLLQEVRPENRAAVKAELARLEATVAAGFSDSIDRDRAGIADRQGLGGPDRLERAEPAEGQPVPPSPVGA